MSPTFWMLMSYLLDANVDTTHPSPYLSTCVPLVMDAMVVHCVYATPPCPIFIFTETSPPLWSAVAWGFRAFQNANDSFRFVSRFRSFALSRSLSLSRHHSIFAISASIAPVVMSCFTAVYCSRLKQTPFFPGAQTSPPFW